MCFFSMIRSGAEGGEIDVPGFKALALNRYAAYVLAYKRGHAIDSALAIVEYDLAFFHCAAVLYQRIVKERGFGRDKFNRRYLYNRIIDTCHFCILLI